MSTRLCFDFHGKKVCVDIPVLINTHVSIPDPIEKSKPQPDPWITGEGLRGDFAGQLQAVATIAAAAKQLSADHQAALHQALAPAVAGIEKNLPGSKVTF